MVHLHHIPRQTNRPRRQLAALIATACATILAVITSGCEPATQGSGSASQPAPLKKVKYVYPISKEVTDYKYFPGTFEAVKSVNITARVSGYLDKINFVDGTEVAEGASLFEIDPRSYKATLARTEANILQQEAHYKRLELDYRRAQNLVNRDVMPREEYDKINGDFAESAGMVASAKADYDLAKLNLNWTKVIAPIAGRLSRRMVDPGNLVRADDTLLTTIVALDPIHVNFDIDEGTVLDVRRLVLGGKVQSRSAVEWVVGIGLFDERIGDDETPEQGYSHRGVVNFSDNVLNVGTGTLRVRAILNNPIAKGNTRLFTPGLAAKIRMPIGEPHPAVLVPANSIGNSQNKKYVFIINDQDVLEKRDVKVGADIEGMLTIEQGLKPNEKVRVVAEGVQNLVENKLKVTPVLWTGGSQRTSPGVTVPPAILPPASPKSDDAPPPTPVPAKAALPKAG